MSRIRSCHFHLVLYPDDISHMFALNTLDKCGYDYVGILHDQDTNDDGSLKKPHNHVLVSFPRQKDLHVVANDLGIVANYIEPSRNRQQTIRYFLHLDHPNKAQYSADLLYGSGADSARSLVSSGDKECDKVKALLALLDTMPVPCTYRRFLVACCDADLYSVFRRLGVTLRYLLDEHNGFSGF